MDSAPVANADRLESEVKDAFETWTKVTGNKLRFEFVSDKNAEITVSWATSTAGLRYPTEAGDANVDYVTSGAGKRTIKNPGDITRSRIKLLTIDINHKAWLPGQLRLVALHEIGHSIGVFGHSPKPGDIMYQQNGAQELSARDINTVNVLYETVSGY